MSLEFTSRELDTLACLLRGRSLKSIATILNISKNTVKTHMRSIMTKLNINSKEHIINHIEKEKALYAQLVERYTCLAREEKEESILLSTFKIDNSMPLRHLFKLIWVFVLMLLIVIGWVFRWVQFSSASFIRSDLYVPVEPKILHRQSMLKKIDNVYAQENNPIKIVVLCGIGGAGKTVLARQYARQRKEAVVWEIKSETRDKLLNSFLDLAHQLALTTAEKKELSYIKKIDDHQEYEKQVLSFVKQKIKKHKSWFFIFDNTERFSDIHPYLPYDEKAWGQGKVLITTRNGNISKNSFIQSMQVINVEELTRQEQLDLFCKIQESPLLNKRKLDLFLKEIPLFPLDVAIAAYHIKNTKDSYEDYINLIQNKNKNFHEASVAYSEEINEYPETRQSLIACEIDRLLKKQQEFVGLLLLVSAIDCQNIPKDLLKKYCNLSLSNHFIEQMNQASLLRYKEEETTSPALLCMNRSIQKLIFYYILHHLTEREKLDIFNKVSDVLYDYADKIIESHDYSKIRELIPHLSNFIKHKQLGVASYAKIALQLGRIYDGFGDFLKARPLLERGVVFFRSGLIQYGKYDKLLPKTLSYIGTTYHRMGYWQQAEKTFRECISLYQKHFTDQPVELAHTLLGYGWTHTALGNYKEAINTLNQGAAIYIKHCTEAYIPTAMCFFRIAGTYVVMGDTEKAKQYCARAFRIFKKLGNSADQQMVWVLARFNAIFRLEGSYIKSLKYIEEAHSSSLKIGKNNQSSPGLIWVTSCLCRTYLCLGLYRKAEPLLQWLVKNVHQYYGQDNIYTAWFCLFLGQLYLGLGNYKAAQQILEKSCKIYNEQLGENHIESVHIKRALAKTYVKLNLLDEAEKLYKQCLSICKKHYGNTHTEYAQFLCDAACLFTAKGDFVTAEKMITKSLDILQKKNHAEAYRCYECLGDLYKKKCQNDMANKYYVKSLAFAKSHFTKDSAHISRLKTKIPFIQRQILFVKNLTGHHLKACWVGAYVE